MPREQTLQTRLEKTSGHLSCFWPRSLSQGLPGSPKGLFPFGKKQPEIPWDDSQFIHSTNIYVLTSLQMIIYLWNQWRALGLAMFLILHSSWDGVVWWLDPDFWVRQLHPITLQRNALGLFLSHLQGGYHSYLTSHRADKRRLSESICIKHLDYSLAPSKCKINVYKYYFHFCSIT